MLKKVTKQILKTTLKLNDNQLREFDKKFDEVNEVVRACNNPQEALRKYGVTSETIEQAKLYVDKPILKPILSLFNMGGDKARTVLDNLNSKPAPKQALGGELDSLQDRLARLK